MQINHEIMLFWYFFVLIKSESEYHLTIPFFGIVLVHGKIIN